ncbi:P-loop containing nucleoside triphosphate hydrolase protein [Xylaria digitata]|nr:P-loop containing nucleoside triphosphate hydrolase protein [Xylaria digitata]
MKSQNSTWALGKRPDLKQASSSSKESERRSQHLNRTFNNVLKGNWKIIRLHTARDFLESISSQQDKTTCLERLASSKPGQEALHRALVFTDSPQFMNTAVSGLLSFFEDPELRRLCDGELLTQILWVVVDPPLFWNNLLQNARSLSLNCKAVEGFAWLLLQLIMLPSAQSKEFRETAESLLQEDSPLGSCSPKASLLMRQIKALASPSSAPGTGLVSSDGLSPGGRHDNDFTNYRDIAILPTRQELLSTERPFYLHASSVSEADSASRALVHLDNQFRLLREDMIGEMQDEFRNVANERQRRSTFIQSLTFEGFDESAMAKERPCTMVFQCGHDVLGEMLNIQGSNTLENRKKALKRATNFLRHQSFGCLVKGNNALGFASIDRNENLLALNPPQICLRITSLDSLEQILSALQQEPLDYLQLSTPVFAYEPILDRLQRKTNIELEGDILSLSSGPQVSPILPQVIVNSLRMQTIDCDLQPLLRLPKSVSVDSSQVQALIHGLTYQTSLIQGPPGTGKSLVGALLAKALVDNTGEILLILSFTNHALDQFIEDLMDIGIDDDMIVRLGSKCTTRTAPLLLSAQSEIGAHGKRARYELIDYQKDHMNGILEEIGKHSDEFFRDGISLMQILEYLQFSQTDGHFYDAMLVPEALEGETIVGTKGKKMQPDYLLRRWESGKNAGVLSTELSNSELSRVWNLKKSERLAKIQEWKSDIGRGKLQELTTCSKQFNKSQKTLQRLRKERTEQILRAKRIIACTTTAASMYAAEIQSASPGIMIVEEAGEILESHILAAMAPTTKQLIQIGDHKQLRPKIKNFKLSVEARNGYDLNRSLFERLILQGRPSCTLMNQHRMRPEISELIRHNYTELNDAQNTLNRPNLLGFQDNVIFVDHSNPEAKHNILLDKSDQAMKSSKQNVWEADMVLKCLRRLAQQNYKTDDIVILTPYLGQLSLLREKLSQDHDPILSDLDGHDLVEAGIMPAASAGVNKKPIRLSTIDNYQGEESDIVIASLTRSNVDGEIGFMAAPERLNVLVSRARNALIMIGNADTFMGASKGREEWIKLFNRLKSRGRIYDGFPVKCEKHPDRMMAIRSPDEFDLQCPDGGCAEPCPELLSCGKHTCPKRCHIRVDHSTISCGEVLNDYCVNGHQLVWQCSDRRPPACQTCRLEKEEKERKARRDKDLELERQTKRRAYAKQLAAVKDAISYQQQALKDQQEEKLRERTLRQHQAELARVTQEAKKPPHESPQSQPQATVDSDLIADEKNSNIEEITQKQEGEQHGTQAQFPTNKSLSENQAGEDSDAPDVSYANEAEPTLVRQPSSAETDWQQQKELEFASNEALDSLMQMIGLESVKKEFLNIKARVDTSIRQGVDLKGDRFGAALLGNPGTGKTTVARLYGNFLSSMGVIPGGHFEETTGSRLAHDGIQGAQALLDNLLQNGGGVFFLDEAYQIVSSSSTGGSQVLDFLLAEIENCIGKIVFVFAGYRKQMEAFFAHNPGIPSRIPIRLDFQDYEDNELLQIMNHELDRKFSGRMKIEGGARGLYMRIASRRIGRGRGIEADRLHKRRQHGDVPDDLLLRKIDIIGPEPSHAISSNKDWKTLHEMVGLKAVKQSIQALLDRLQANYERELNEQPLIGCSLNKVFVGNPGTGKTTVAKLYGKVLAALGLLSNGEVVEKKPTDFIGSALGHSEKNTKAILEATKGKVLIIDEAYALAGGSSDTGGIGDPYRTAVIDTVVAEVQSTALEDRCVLLLGYPGQMEDMFQKVNPGLARRFPMSSAFVFEDYDDSELRSILDIKLKHEGFRAGEVAKQACISILGRARNRPNFGNVGAVNNILDEAKVRQQKRLAESIGLSKTDWFEPQDIDPDFNRLEHAATNIGLLFKDVVGCEDIIQKLEGYQQEVKNMKGMGFSDVEIRSQIPFGILFRGPPGTGKTSTARKMGKLYYDLGLLSEAKVVDCSATDLIGQYVGQTGPKVQKKFDEALSRVLFIDEAYRLAEGPFAKEAMDEIVDCMTKERYQNKILVVLAGYDNDINRLMNQNPGLTSRFPETMQFYHLSQRHCRDLLFQCLSMRKLDTTQLDASPTLDSKLLDLFAVLTRTPSWGNARDVQTLAKKVFSKMSKAKTEAPTLVITEDVVVDVINRMIKERSSRAAALSPAFDQSTPSPIQTRLDYKEPLRSEASTTSTTEISTEVAAKPEEKDTPPVQDSVGPGPKGAIHRDAGVSDEVWQQLQRDKEAMENRQRDLAAARQKAAELEQQARAQEEEFKRQRDDAARREALRKLELIRIERDIAETERRNREEKMKKELETKARLKRMGVCPMGYEWIPQAGGYRCTGGSHYMTNKQLGI